MLASAGSLGGLSDTQLLTTLKEGALRSDWVARNAAITELYRRYAPNLATTWLRRTRDPDMTQEVLQETFVRATSRGHTIPDDHSVLIWLRTTARNYWLDRKRHEQLASRYDQSQRPGPEPPSPPEAGFERSVIREVDRRKTRAVFQMYLRQLSALDRQVMALRLRGLQRAEICRQIGLSEAESRRSYARIRFLLQKMRLRGFLLTLDDLGALIAPGEGADD